MNNELGITRQELGEIYEAYDHFFPAGVFNQKDIPFGNWKNKKEFVGFIKEKTKVDISSGNPKLIKDSQLALERIVINEEKAESNRPSNEQLEVLEKEAEERLAKQKETTENAKNNVEAGIKRQEELHTSLKNKKIYAQVKRNEKAPTSEEIKADQVAAELKSKVELKPDQTPLDRQKQVAAVAAKIIEERVAPILEKDLTREEIRFRSERAAVKLAEALENPQVIENNTSFTEKTAVFEAMATNSKVVPDGGQIAAGNIAAIRSMSIEGDRAMVVAAFGEGFGKYFGLPASAFDVSLSDNPVRGANEVNLGEISTQYGQILSQQSSLLDSISGFAKGQARDFIFKQFSSSIESKIATGASNEIIKNILSGVSGGSVTISVDSAFLTNFAANIPGGMGIINGIGNLFGINIVSGGAAGAVGGAVATAGAEAAAGAAGGAVAAGAAEAVAATVPVAGWIVAAAIFVAKKVVGWIKDKLPAIKKFLRENGGPIGLLLFGGGLITGSVLVGALGVPFLIGGVATSANLAAFGGGIASFFGALGSAVGVSIGLPILIALLVFPVIVALILFIINSGAYIVPPSSGVAGSCESTEKPVPEDVVKSKDGKYAFPLANAGKIGLSCTHWDKSLATDIFTGHFTGDKFPVLAYTSGTIEGVSLNDSLGGKYIILKGNDGRYYYYAHNCALYVKSGDSVNVGDVIATTDNSGSAAKTPEHSHFAISVFPNFTAGGTVCPSKDFEDKFNLGRCKPSNECVP